MEAEATETDISEPLFSVLVKKALNSERPREDYTLYTLLKDPLAPVMCRRLTVPDLSGRGKLISGEKRGTTNGERHRTMIIAALNSPVPFALSSGNLQ